MPRKVKQNSKKYDSAAAFPHPFLCTVYIRQKATRFFHNFPNYCGKLCGNCAKVLHFKAKSRVFEGKAENFACGKLLVNRIFQKNLISQTFSLLHKLVKFV